MIVCVSEEVSSSYRFKDSERDFVQSVARCCRGVLSLSRGFEITGTQCTSTVPTTKYGVDYGVQA